LDEPLEINQRKKCPALDFSDDKESNNSDSITRLTKIHEDSGEENIESERVDSEKVRQVPYTSEF